MPTLVSHSPQEITALYGQLKSMQAELNELKGNKTSLTEDKIIKIPESKYVALTEMNDDLTRKVEEQAILIKNYELSSSVPKASVLARMLRNMGTCRIYR